jgi:hypothetical protein
MRTRVTSVLLAVFALLLPACDWRMGGFTGGRAGFNPEDVLTQSNVGGITEQWNAVMPRPVEGQGRMGGMPAVSGGVVYMTDTLSDNPQDRGRLYAFDAAGQTNCTSGTPRSCQPLWSGVIQTNATTAASDAAVGANGVYVTASDYVQAPEGFGALYAFDPHGTTNCSGSPKVCTPLWTARVPNASGNFFAGSPVVNGGRIYVPMSGVIQVFDEGARNCSGSPKVCPPLFAIAASGNAFAVADGKIYAGGGSNNPSWVAYDATGQQNCSGTPLTCEPLFGGIDLSACQDSNLIQCDGSPPVIANGKLFMGVSGFDVFGGLHGSFSAFDAAGVQNCHSPGQFFDVECDPVWTTGHQAATYYAASASNNRVYVGRSVASTPPLPPTSSIATFDMTGAPQGTYGSSGGVTITSGLIFVDAFTHIDVFSTSGGGALTSIPIADPVGHGWQLPVYNGRIYVPANNILRVYGLS